MTSTGLVPLLRYRDVAAALDWLCAAFGFEQRSVVHDPDGTIAYAELSYGHGLVMIGPVGESILDRLLKQPDEIGGIATQSCYVAVDNVEAHFLRAKAAGADIVLDFGSDEAGDRAYAARDSEGHIWNFGAYSPWRALTSEAARIAAPIEGAVVPPPSKLQAVLAGCVAVIALAAVAGVTQMDPPPAAALRATALEDGGPAANNGQLRPPALDDAARERDSLRAALDRETHARREAARIAASVREALTRERAARQAAETEATTLKTQLLREREARLTPQPSPDPAPASTSDRKSDRTTNDPTRSTLAAPLPAEKPAALEAMKPVEIPPAAAAPTTTGSLGDTAKPPEPLFEMEPDTDLAEPEPDEAATTATPNAQTEGPAATPATASPAAAKATKKERVKPARRAKAPAAKKSSSSASKPVNPLFMYD